MFDFQEKRKIRRILYSKASIAVVLLLTGLLSISVFERFKVERNTAQKLEDRQAELDVLNTRAEALRAKVDHLKNERGLEEEIRNRFDVAKEGEEVIVIIGDEKDNNPASTSTVPPPKAEERSWFDVFKF